ncbi:MAG: flavin reductase (DIM6/NTAB) family NADH-FMN oxidoreductase RutF [Lentisphaeria bacterium]|jgi:flavin reductase (DIM6/NTAB) family NADH-FMN oxidoreductase RutF
MIFDFSSLSASQIYQNMTQMIIPRPIAWILTDNGEIRGADVPSYNLAPFSYFNAVCSDPPLVMISLGKKPSGEAKDTRVNIEQRHNLVIHIAGESDASAVTASAATLPHGESEVDALNMKLVDQPGWLLPRLSDAKIAMACTLYEIKELGPQRQALIFCQINQVFVTDEAVTYDNKQRTKVDASVISPLARLGASEYATFGEVFTIVRPE